MDYWMMTIAKCTTIIVKMRLISNSVMKATESKRQSDIHRNLYHSFYVLHQHENSDQVDRMLSSSRHDARLSGQPNTLTSSRRRATLRLFSRSSSFPFSVPPRQLIA